MRQENMTARLVFSTGIALLFHISGYLGMVSPQKEWFIAMTPWTLLLMTMLVFINEKKIDNHFLGFALLSAFCGFGSELIGVNTGLLFGDYAYGSSMGIKWLGVPLLIGIQWFITAYGAAQLTLLFFKRSLQSVKDISVYYKIALVVSGAALTMIFDFILEPAAIHLGYWNWKPAGVVPVYNYVCWFMVSAVILAPYFFTKKEFSNTNAFVPILLIVEAVFFLLLGI